MGLAYSPEAAGRFSWPRILAFRRGKMYQEVSHSSSPNIEGGITTPPPEDKKIKKRRLYKDRSSQNHKPEGFSRRKFLEQIATTIGVGSLIAWQAKQAIEDLFGDVLATIPLLIEEHPSLEFLNSPLFHTLFTYQSNELLVSHMTEQESIIPLVVLGDSQLMRFPDGNPIIKDGRVVYDPEQDPNHRSIAEILVDHPAGTEIQNMKIGKRRIINLTHKGATTDDILQKLQDPTVKELLASLPAFDLLYSGGGDDIGKAVSKRFAGPAGDSLQKNPAQPNAVLLDYDIVQAAKHAGINTIQILTGLDQLYHVRRVTILGSPNYGKAERFVFVKNDGSEYSIHIDHNQAEQKVAYLASVELALRQTQAATIFDAYRRNKHGDNVLKRTRICNLLNVNQDGFGTGYHLSETEKARVASEILQASTLDTSNAKRVNLWTLRPE